MISKLWIRMNNIIIQEAKLIFHRISSADTRIILIRKLKKKGEILI